MHTIFFVFIYFRGIDSRIFSPMLYQLSYSTVWRGAKLCKIWFANKIFF